MAYRTFAVPTAVPPFDRANWLSKLTFAWVQPLVAVAKSRPLAADDLTWSLPSPGALFSRCDGAATHFLATFLANRWPSCAVLALVQLLVVAGRVYGPGYVVFELVSAATDPTPVDATHVFWCIGSLYLVHVLKTFLETHAEFVAHDLGAQLALEVHVRLFDRAVTRGASQPLSAAETHALLHVVGHALLVWAASAQLVAVLILFFNLVNYAIVVGIVAIFGLVVLRTFVAMQAARVRATTAALTAQREQHLADVFAAILSVKLFAWEETALADIAALRRGEVDALHAFSGYITAWTTLMHCTPIVGMLVVVLTSTLWFHDTLSLATLFSALALADALRAAIVEGASALKLTLQYLVYLRHVDMATDSDAATYVLTAPGAQYAKEDPVVVAIDHASFGWSSDLTLLHKVNLKLYRGEFVVVHGAAGQGKSSLLHILLGTMPKRSGGSVYVATAVAYVAQDPWLQLAATIRDNILFGMPYDRVAYDAVVDACALTDVVAALPIGDRASVEALTPSQRRRVALARACYSGADVLLLDAPLDGEASDGVVVTTVFRKCFLGLLKHKTIILVTNDTATIESTDVHRTFLVQHGDVLETTYDTMTQVVASPPPSTACEVRADTIVQSAAPAFYESFGFSPRALQFDDDADDSTVARSPSSAVLALVSYGRALGGLTVVSMVLGSTVAIPLTKLSSDLWLSHWVPTTPPYAVGTYAWFLLWRGVALALHSTLVLSYGSHAAQRLFHAVLLAVLRVRAVDAPSLDAIQRHFAHDIATCDLTLPATLARVLLEASHVVLVVGTAFWATPSSTWLVLAPLVGLYAWFTATYGTYAATDVPWMRQTTQAALARVTRDMVDGAATIRAFGATPRAALWQVYLESVHQMCAAHLNASGAAQWLHLRAQLVAHTAVVVVLAMTHHASPGLVGLVATYMLTLPPALATLLDVWVKCRRQLHAPERLDAMSHVETDGGRGLSTYDEWPTEGRVVFQNVSVRDRSIQNINVVLRGGEKVGVMGPAASTVAMALFRLADTTSGTIKIDGINIATLGLHVLRRSLAIIPHAPVLFDGTLRRFVDPLDECTDAALWDVLGKVDLVDRVANAAGKLSTLLGVHGMNFTVVERRLLCLARAVLQQAKIVVVVDETPLSAPVEDIAMNERLRRVVRDDLAASTVLTIAPNRVDADVDCSRVLVIDQGELMQYDVKRPTDASGTSVLTKKETSSSFRTLDARSTRSIK
ncbi:Aste57867_12925 [Aphanomyces stellatus]|uniref:Aste57867_12925 protein n=1 Tax=Aphanomyces stellatus TaxID=120398 RepID=A0A485KYG8_9STRA|nr:hypothetical protein As57867_012877 [Aphanomyces stellatus]VFT89771.1 Aste57867_12925 [Aphanomyces stellatus]